MTQKGERKRENERTKAAVGISKNKITLRLHQQRSAIYPKYLWKDGGASFPNKLLSRFKKYKGSCSLIRYVGKEIQRVLRYLHQHRQIDPTQMTSRTGYFYGWLFAKRLYGSETKSFQFSQILDQLNPIYRN